MPSKEHEELCQVAAKWLKKNGFPVVATNIKSVGTREISDCIGFRASCSAMVEAKVSKSDFKADLKKPERNGESKGFGNFRIYILPEGIIDDSDIPEKWMAIFVENGKVKREIKPKGNMWNNYWSENWFDSCEKSERNFLFSISRRLAKGQDILL